MGEIQNIDDNDSVNLVMEMYEVYADVEHIDPSLFAAAAAVVVAAVVWGVVVMSMVDLIAYDDEFVEVLEDVVHVVVVPDIELKLYTVEMLIAYVLDDDDDDYGDDDGEHPID